MNLNRKSNLEKGANGLPPRRASLRSPAAVSRKFYGAFSTMTAVAALLAPMRPAIAGPTGGTVVEGSAAISQAGNTTNIDQSTNRAVINWLGFSIGQGETVNFYQPTNLSVTLNRVVGNEQSVIAGALNANGRVFIVNSAGVLFTKDAQVNVGGLVASTLDISNKDFMAGNHVFSGSSKASVVNKGNITASAGGYVSLLGKTVLNEGVITATLGTVALASGEKITLNFGGDSLVDVTIDKGMLNALVENKAAIKADGGRVVLTAKAADAVLSAQVNNTGLVQARTIADLTGGSTSGGSVKIGKIKLLATGGTTKVAGKLDASAPKGGKGGVIDTSGDKVKIADGAVVTTKAANGQNGSWIIDPDGFKIAASGGDIAGATLSDQLGSNNVTIYSTSGSGSSGDIDVNDVVAWAANTTLTLNATKAINVNAIIAGSDSNSGLAVNAGTDFNINAPSSLQVASLTATAGGNVNLNAPQVWTTAGAWTFAGKNININDTVGWSAGTLTLNAASFVNLNAAMTASKDASLVVTYDPEWDKSVDADGKPTMTYGTPFGGISPLFDGQSGKFVGKIDFVNNTAPNPLTINGNRYTLITSIGQPTLADGTSNPHDLDVINVNGGVGYYALASDLTAPATAFTSAPIAQIGGSDMTYDDNFNVVSAVGLPGVLDGLGHSIKNLTIEGGADAGNQNLGLIGSDYAFDQGISGIRNVDLQNVNITAASSYIGAAVGYNYGGFITNVYARGSVTVTADTGGQIDYYTNSEYIGGMVGQNMGAVYNSHADVNITTTNSNYVGGFVGFNAAAQGTNFLGKLLPWGSILNSSASGSVNVTIDNQYASQLNAFSDSGFGGFVGTNGGVINGSSSSGAVTANAIGYPGYYISISHVGGFVGANSIEIFNFIAAIDNSFTSSTVKAVKREGGVEDVGYSDIVGGFVGLNGRDANIGNSRAVGPVEGRLDTGGFAGYNLGNFKNNTFNLDTTGQTHGTSLDFNGNSNNYSGGQDAVAVTAEGPSSNQGPPASPTGQQAAAARAQAQSLTEQASSQQAAAAAAAAAEAASRAAALASAKQVASQTANVSMADAQTKASTRPSPRTSTAAGKNAIAAAAAPKIEDLVKIEEPATQSAAPVERPRAHRHAVAPTAQKVHAHGRGSGYGASIRSIDVDGRSYELNNGRRNGAPGQKAQ